MHVAVVVPSERRMGGAKRNPSNNTRLEEHYRLSPLSNSRRNNIAES
jgi:hypothetical protein